MSVYFLKRANPKVLERATLILMLLKANSVPLSLTNLNFINTQLNHFIPAALKLSPQQKYNISERLYKDTPTIKSWGINANIKFCPISWQNIHAKLYESYYSELVQDVYGNASPQLQVVTATHLQPRVTTSGLTFLKDNQYINIPTSRQVGGLCMYTTTPPIYVDLDAEPEVDYESQVQYLSHLKAVTVELDEAIKQIDELRTNPPVSTWQ